METYLFILGILSLFLVLFALYKEYSEHDDAFTANKSNKKDKILESIRKLKGCLSYDQKTIKWRRVFISTFLSIFLIFGILHRRLPSSKEFLIYSFFIFSVFYTSLQYYSARTVAKAILYGKENIKNIRKILLNDSRQNKS